MKRHDATSTAISTSAPPLTESPPSNEPFLYRDYVRAQKEIESAIRKGLFYACITGPSGTGKTSIMRDLLKKLDRHRHHLVYLGASSASLLGVVRYFAETFHVTPRRSSLETSHIVSKAIKEQPAHVVVWIDEAHRLPVQTLSEIYTLAEFDPDIPQVFSIIFSGPIDLCTVLDDRRLFALKRRITVSCSLTGLQRDELDPFLVHRFGKKDATRIHESLRDELFERTQGAPALVIKVVRALLDPSSESDVTEDVLREVLHVQGI